MEWVGNDPYDALRSRRIPAFVRSRGRLRQFVVQARKRCPLDLAALLGVRPFAMVKTIGALMQAEARNVSGGVDRRELQRLGEALLEKAALFPPGAWGYEFDVQTRWSYYPAFSPNLIASVFVARGLLEGCEALGEEAWAAEAFRTADFVADAMYVRSAEPHFRYTLTSPRLVHNANLLGAGVTAAVGAIRQDPAMSDIALHAALTSVRAQRPDGSWPYGVGNDLRWSDSFHTAYNLDGLLLVWLATGDDEVLEALERGVARWVSAFFGPGGEPKYYPDRPYPYDIHSAGTALDVASRLATWGFDTADVARKVHDWSMENLIDPSTGNTYYQKWRHFTDRRHFVRWGDAHWALGAASVSLLEAGLRSPLEASVARTAGVVDR